MGLGYEAKISTTQASGTEGSSGCGLRGSPAPALPVPWTIAQRAHLGCRSSPGHASSRHTGQEPTRTAWAWSSWLLTLPFWMGYQTLTGEGCSGLVWVLEHRQPGRVLRQVEPWHLRVCTRSTQPTGTAGASAQGGGSDSRG